MTRCGLRRRLAKALITACATAILALWAFPIFWALVVALKSESEVLAFPPSLVFKPTLANFGDALVGRFSILPEMWASLVISSLATLLTIVLAVPASYAFARLRLPAGKLLGFYVLATQMLPPVGLVIPYFLILNRVGWLRPSCFHDHGRKCNAALAVPVFHQPRMPAPSEQLLRRQPVPARNRAYRLAALITLGDDPRLLLRGPTAAAPGPGKHLQPANRLGLPLRLR
jgi:hypothetical protein